MKLSKPKLLFFVLVGIVSLILIWLYINKYLYRTNASTPAPAGVKPLGTYTDWYWPDYPATTHTSLDGFLTIEEDPTLVHPRIGYYWANQFFMSGGGGYMGIQTNGEAGDYRGKVAIFAIFGTAIGTQLGSPGSWCVTEQGGFDGGEGSGSTCRIPLPWQAGDTYRLRLSIVSTDATTRTWRATVKNQETGQELVIGNIKTPLSFGLLQGALGNWTEFYSPRRTECDAPHSKVIFGTPSVDNGAQFANSHSNHFSTQGDGCTNSNIQDVAAGVRQEQSMPLTPPSPPLPTGGTQISDMEWSYATTGYGEITKDQSVTKQGPINLAGKTYSKGIGTHANSEIRYQLNGNYDKFVSEVNLDYAASGSVTYQVWADGVKLFDSGRMDSFSITKRINVDVINKNELKLIVTDAGDGINADWAAWADARLISQTQTATPTPTPTATPAPQPTSLSLNLLLHGIGKGGDSANPGSNGNPNPLRSQRSIQIEIFNDQNQLIHSQSGQVNFEPISGSFKGIIDVNPALPTGFYTLKIKSGQFLKSQVAGIQTLTRGTVNSISQTVLINGDVTGDNKVNILDYSLLLDCYSDLTPAANCIDPVKKLSTDLTDDGAVNQFDYNLFLRELTNITGQ